MDAASGIGDGVVFFVWFTCGLIIFSYDALELLAEALAVLTAGISIRDTSDEFIRAILLSGVEAISSSIVESETV